MFNNKCIQGYVDLIWCAELKIPPSSLVVFPPSLSSCQFLVFMSGWGLYILWWILYIVSITVYKHCTLYIVGGDLNCSLYTDTETTISVYYIYCTFHSNYTYSVVHWVYKQWTYIIYTLYWSLYTVNMTVYRLYIVWSMRFTLVCTL